MGVIVSDNFSADKINMFLNKAENKNLEFAYHHLVKADALRIKNYFWESIDEYLNAIKYDDSNVEAYIGLGLSYKQIGYLKSAVSAFNSAKKLNFFDKQLYFESGCCFCIDQKFSQAINEFKKALKISPDFIEAEFNLAFTRELNSQYDSAIQGYKKIIGENPQHIKSYNNLGSLYIKLELYRKAIKVFSDLLKIDSDYTRAYLGIALSFDKLKKRSNALRYYRKYLKLNPNSENLPYILERIDELKKGILSVKNSHLMLVS